MSSKYPPIVWIDQPACVQCGSCYKALPEVFAPEDDGTALVHNPNGASKELIQEALDRCAGGCIHWR